MQRQFSSECIVHQFLESHKHDSLPDAHASAPSEARASGQSNHKHEDVSEEIGLESYVEPKGKSVSITSKRLSVIEPESDSSTASGQFDEKSWKTTVTKSRSELDLAGQEHEGIHSRLLTKKQLTDMAWGVRELSRRLGMVRLKFRAENIFILTKVYDEDLIPKTRELAKWLLSKQRDVRYTVYIQDELKDNRRFDMPGLIEELRQEYIEAGEMDQDTPREAMSRRMRTWTEEMCRKRPHTFDFIIALGGDGTVLYASWLFQRIVPPVLSFALGSLGFLTKFDFNEYQNTLNTAFTVGVTVSLRLRFEGTIMRSQERKHSLGSSQDSDGNGSAHQKRDLVEELIGEEKDDDHTHKPEGTFEILNEIVVDRGPNPSMFQNWSR
jgi:NAD+ kinase